MDAGTVAVTLFPFPPHGMGTKPVSLPTHAPPRPWSNLTLPDSTSKVWNQLLQGRNGTSLAKF